MMIYSIGMNFISQAIIRPDGLNELVGKIRNDVNSSNVSRGALCAGLGEIMVREVASQQLCNEMLKILITYVNKEQVKIENAGIDKAWKVS